MGVNGSVFSGHMRSALHMRVDLQYILGSYNIDFLAYEINTQRASRLCASHLNQCICSRPVEGSGVWSEDLGSGVKWATCCPYPGSLDLSIPQMIVTWPSRGTPPGMP